MTETKMTYRIETLSGRGLPTGTDADGYDTREAAEAMADAMHDGEYRIVPMSGAKTYHWRTDAASGDIEAADADAVVARLVAIEEWSPIGSHDEARYIADGAWLCVSTDGVECLTRGEVSR